MQLGKTYGYSGEELRTYVENRLTKDEERLERAQSRTQRTAQQKTESDVLGQVEELRVKLRELSDGSSVSAGSSFMKSFDSQEQRPPRIPVPKYENKQDVRRYLDVFESLMSANGYAEKDWLLALRSAVMGTKLETTLEGLDHYEEAKKEILLEHGQSVDKVWKELVSVRQGDESFHRYTSRVVKQLIQWLSLGGIKADVISSPDSTAGKICLLLAKQLIMDGVSEELKAYLKERKVAELSYEEFQAVGSSYQEAHGRPTAKAAAKTRLIDELCFCGQYVTICSGCRGCESQAEGNIQCEGQKGLLYEEQPLFLLPWRWTSESSSVNPRNVALRATRSTTPCFTPLNLLPRLSLSGASRSGTRHHLHT